MSTSRINQKGFQCPCCLSLQQEGLDVWHHVCKVCGYESAQFRNAINMEHTALSETHREEGLRTLRESNFRELLAKMRPHLSGRHQTLLEVGCGHGWFLRIAGERFAALGIEPDHQIFLAARARGVDVIEGYFPDALNQSDRFDIIVFNDVFEHIPDPATALNACLGALNEGGMLVLNLPTSEGLFYRMARVARRVGLGGAFARMWQKDFPSPHLHYFSRRNLELLLQRHGFRVVSTGTLPSIRLSGLYSRIAYADPSRWLHHAMVWLALVLFYPVVKSLPSDVMVVMAMPDGMAPRT